jgi:hypothetical protein
MGICQQNRFAPLQLIVFTENGKVYVLKATKWPAGKPMSAAELLKYIAEHAV